MCNLSFGGQPDLLLAGIPLFLELAQVLDRTSYLFVAGLDGVDQLLAGDIEFRLGGDQLAFQRRLIATTGSGDLPLDAFDIRLQRSQGMKVGMLGRDGILDGLLLQIQCIQRGQLGLQP